MSPPLSSFGVVWGAQTNAQRRIPKEAKPRVSLQRVGDPEEGVGLKADAESEPGRWISCTTVRSRWRPQGLC